MCIKLVFSIIVCQLTIFSNAVIAQSSNKETTPPTGLHYVFDASESMCGFLAGDPAKNPLFNQIKLAVSGQNSEIGNRVYLLKQMGDAIPNAQRDIVEAPANLESLAEQVNRVAAKSKKSCQPFNGSASNIELIFSAESPTQESDAVLFITDAQLVEEDRERFVQGFSSWMRAASANGGKPSVGVALVESEFSGRYFSVSEANSRHRSGPYLLGTHNRPLLLIWLAKSNKHLLTIKEAVSSFVGNDEASGKNNKGFVQHLLPRLAVGTASFQEKVNFKPGLAALVGAKPKISFEKYNMGRTDTILSGCLSASIENDRIILEADVRCRDHKPLFEGIAAIKVSFPIADNSLFMTTAAAPNDERKGFVTFDLTGKSYGVQPFVLQHSTDGTRAVNKIDVKTFSLDADRCAEISVTKRNKTEKADIDACTNKLTGKTYQLDILFAQLFTRQKLVVEQLLAPLNNMKYTFEFRQKK